MYETLVDEPSEVLTQLMDKAESLGYLTTEDIVQAFPREEDSRDLLDELFAFLRGADIKIYSDMDEVPEDIQPHGLVYEGAEFDLSQVATEDTVGMYLKETVHVPLLTHEEEIDLAKRYEGGKDASDHLIGTNGVPSDPNISALRCRVEDGCLAREQLIKANTRLVISIAKRYLGRGLPFLDLIQEGNLGLMKAVEKYDYRRGFRFSTYATWWIRQTVTRAVADQGRTIRVPVHMSDRIRELYKTAHQFEQWHGRRPTPEEIAEQLGLEPRKVRWMLRVSTHPLSLEQPVGEDDGAEFGSFIEDDRSPAPSQMAYGNLLGEKVEEILTTLSPREACILRLRFGFQNGQTHTLEQVGKKFGLTRERIRQIEGRALRRLRHPRRARMLKRYLS